MEIFVPVKRTHDFITELQAVIDLQIERDRLLLQIASEQKTMQPNAIEHSEKQIDVAAFISRCFHKALDDKSTSDLREVERLNYARKLVVRNANRVLSSKFANARVGICLDMFNAMRYVERVGSSKLPMKRS